MIAFLPKSKGNAYFVSCKQGADEAAKDLGLELLFDGPTNPDPAKQNEIVENWVTLGVDAIAAACENKEGLSTALRKARAKGIKVLTYDADALPDARFVVVEPFWYSDDRPASLDAIIGWVHDATDGIGADWIPDASHWIEHHPEWMASDGLHPNDAGYAEMARRMDAALTGLGL